LPDDTRTRAQIEKYIQSGGRDGSLIDAIYDDVVELESLKSTRDRLIDQVMNRFKGSEVVKHERARNLKNVKDRLVVEKQRVADALALLPPDDDDNDDDDDDKPKISAAAVSILRNMVDDLTFTDINKGRFIDIVGILEGGDIGFSSLKNIRTRLNELLHDIDENEDELDMHIHDIYSTGIPYAQIDGIEAEVRILSGEADRLTKAHAVWVSGRDKYNEHNAEITSWWSSEIKRRIPTMWTQDEKSIDEQLAAAEIAYNAIDHKTPAGIAEYERLVTALRKLKRSAPDVGMDDTDELRLLYTESESSHKNVTTAISALDIFLRGLSGAPGRRAFVNFLRDQMSQPSSGIVRVDSLEALGAGFLKARPDDSKPMNDRITAFNDKITTAGLK
ncbi:MAG: hypothetical protein EBY22_16765, partial [Gammaproteobacteria bacterium]|nr:hypothetical protein [Gammaproteobacteria bacterium]